jgi:prophage tail gpP-like protein
VRNPDDEMVLEVAGEIWRGWTDVSVQRGIEQVAGTFDLTLTAHNDGGDWRPIQVAPGMPCRVSVAHASGRETLITGHIDDVLPSYDAQSHAVQVQGRDAAGDLVDCSAVHAPSGEWHGAGLLTIAQDLSKPFGVPVRAAAGVDLGAQFGTFRIQEGETVWEALERACRMRGVLAMSDGAGSILIARPSAAASTGVTISGPGRPILAAEGTISWRERHSAYTVKGQAALDDIFGAVEDATAVTGRATDPAVTRHRPLILIAEDVAGDGVMTLDGRAAFEARTRSARGRRLRITLTGWRNDRGALWQPLTLVTVRDTWLGIDGELLIASVEFQLSAQDGTRTTLHLIGPEAFDVLPPKAEKAGKMSGGIFG